MPSLILSHLLLIWLALQRLALCVERASTRERFKVVIAPLICKRTCMKGQCQDTCEQGNNTTLIGENGQSADILTGPGFRVVVCPLTCMNGGMCSARTHCLCPPGFTGRLCQFPLRTQASRGNKQPFYTVQSQGLSDQGSTGGRQQLTHTHSVFTLPLSQGAGHHSSEVQVNVRVLHTPDTSVVIHPLDQSENKPHSPKTVTRLSPQPHKPKGRCFQETTPKQACSSNPLPGLTNQEDCCGSVGNSWGQNKCYKCPLLPYAGKHQTIVEDFGSTCPQGYKRLNITHCQDINECMMQGLCQNGECLNTQGSFRCTCKLGYVLIERTRCVAPSVEQGPCFRMVTEAGKCEHVLPTRLSQEICCCTVGKAWGSNCERCPQDGTASFNKICPAGKGMSVLTYRSTLSIQPFQTSFEHNPNPKNEFKPPEVPVQTTTHLSPISTHGPRIPVIVAKPTLPPYVWVPPESDTPKVPLEHPPTAVSPIDECKLSRNICGQGECVNTPNGFSCHCHAGYQPHAQRKSCVDENECDSEPCGRGICINTVGSYRCNCYNGFKLVVQNGKRRCIDINECSKPDICGIGGQCINLHGSYKCECLPGFKSKSRRQPSCEDINECLDPHTCPDEQCENTVGSYECIPCQPGYHAQGGVCYDINECQKRGVCLNGRCENLQGSHRCLCNEGFLPEADSKGCRDINECLDNRLCANGQCINTEGSFRCQCFSGYQPTQEGSHCEDINECERASNCQRGRCINTMGSYRCECQKGYMLVSGRRCQDIDECSVDRSLCQPHGVCENRQGGYVCVCNDGYMLSEDKHSCEEVMVDLNNKKECYLNLDDTVFCDSVLATNVSKQECCCSIGVGWGDHCEIYPCPVYHSAEYHSLCPIGRGFYHEEGKIEYGLPAHRDIDECVLFSNEICKEGRCMNTQPGFECYCQQGFYYDGNLLECIDVDECHDESLCTNGHCVNTRGSFYCTCNPPWVPDATNKNCVFPTVTDVDECQDPANCKNGHCVNTQDSYYCICTSPWILATDRNGCVTPEEQAVTGVSVVHLSDVNECEDPSYCRNGKCVNTPGSFHCICKQPLTFSAALKQCVYDDRTAAHKDICFREVDEDLMCTMPRNELTVTYSECCCHYGRGWGPECRTCPNRNSVLFNRLCEMHLETESDGEGDFLAAFSSYNPERDSSEEDSDECSCANGRCVRSYLGTMCECNPGFVLDHSRTRCTDIDECAGRGSGQSPCKNARCINTFGSFRCHCKLGFVAARRPNVCIRARAQ
ncbi:latent-transforming growth factor beta-binding protein 3 isoform X1 [Triplophysa rosa]|uniref:Latent transforming growth factor binding protein n=1 Tax=Triplophysa rosa TaxID=992332 RepID=A0A9W7X1N9_TRIRA|nr:latent-transforming growth factor beta-binding protein 3 isoform X1 [Triplophysa rosa]KAI7812482.1 latent transforming growth factor binding protein precursor [Triplophysa rosa]